MKKSKNIFFGPKKSTKNIKNLSIKKINLSSKKILVKTSFETYMATRLRTLSYIYCIMYCEAT